MSKIKKRNLYFIITGEYCCGRSAVEVAKAAIAGGVDIIQLREKDTLRSNIVNTARLIGDLCRKKRVTFIINDDPILAKEVDADGVHLGQGDLKLFTVAEARNILGAKKIIGLSTASVEDARRAEAEKIDYIGFGPIFPTTVKKGCVGTKNIGKIMALSTKPVVFIGGINLTNIDRLLAKGARSVAVIRAISEADDVKAAAKKIKQKLIGKKWKNCRN